MGRMSRQKGASFERGIANDLKVIFGADAKRGIGQTRSAREVADVDGTPFWLELKNKKALSISKVVEQARSETDGRPPVLVIKHGRSEILACVPWALFVRILEELDSVTRARLKEWAHLPIFQAGQIAEAQEISAEVEAKIGSGDVGDWESVMLERQAAYVRQERNRRTKATRKKP